jgi:hypothetical protein
MGRSHIPPHTTKNAYAGFVVFYMSNIVELSIINLQKLSDLADSFRVGNQNLIFYTIFRTQLTLGQ